MRLPPNANLRRSRTARAAYGAITGDMTTEILAPDDERLVRETLLRAFSVPLSELTLARIERSVRSAAGQVPSRRRPHSVRRGLASAAAGLLVATSAGAAAASTRALPGQLLYPLKQAVERARVVVASGAAEADLELDHAERRLEEIARTGAVASPVAVANLWSAFEAHLAAALAIGGEGVAERVDGLRQEAAAIAAALQASQTAITGESSEDDQKGASRISERPTEPGGASEDDGGGEGNSGPGSSDDDRPTDAGSDEDSAPATEPSKADTPEPRKSEREDAEEQETEDDPEDDEDPGGDRPDEDPSEVEEPDDDDEVEQPDENEHESDDSDESEDGGSGGSGSGDSGPGNSDSGNSGSGNSGSGNSGSGGSGSSGSGSVPPPPPPPPPADGGEDGEDKDKDKSDSDEESDSDEVPEDD